ncbi:MAG: cysteine rich repeat-containing protein [Candidatus Caenarcaniphilales bacterium]|nr:cysteine rich repeat-containing protein [Candidatus Caenarcaniphilales bacterium]
MPYLLILILLVCTNFKTFAASLSNMSNAEAIEMLKVCNNDIRNHCDAVEPGNNRVIFCLTKRLGQLETPCQKLVEDFMSKWENTAE